MHSPLPTSKPEMSPFWPETELPRQMVVRERRYTFKVQAVDDTGNVSDVTPVDAEILFAPSVAIAPGTRGLLNGDGLLTPEDTTLTAWKESATTHSGTLHVIVKLLDK